MKNPDLLIHPAWLVTVDADDRVLTEHSLAIADGRIADILPSAEARRRYAEAPQLELPGQALMPGLINAHTHLAMSLLRGYADDLPLMSWLQEHIWPAEGRFADERFCEQGALLAMAELIRGGVTCFNDMYFFPEATARAAERAGLRGLLGIIVLDFPSAWGSGPDEYIRRGLSLHDALRDHPRLGTAFAPHAPYTVSREPLQRIATLAAELDIPVHIHLHETAGEVANFVAQHGCRPLARLDELGLLGPQLLAVHMTQLEEAEIQRVAETGSHVLHCPESNLKLASGFCPLARLDDAGVNLALGTDGSASNNDLDMFGELRSAALLAKGVSGDAAALPAHRALRMATIDGARALGLDALTGSLETGKAADLIAVDLDTIETQPLYDPVAQLVYASGRQQVSHVWVDGRQLLRERHLTTLDETELRHSAADWGRRIAAARTAGDAAADRGAAQ